MIWSNLELGHTALAPHAQRTVDVHVAGIPQKIELEPHRPRRLLTIHRRGYKFVG